MFGSYIKIALRMLIKNKLYAAINVVGLAIGLAMYLLSGLITDYERNHDHMFANRDRIYTIASVHNPSRNHGNIETRGTYMALKPLIEVQMPELEGVSRGLNFETLLKAGDKAFYQDIKFVDQAFTTIFNFDYIHGFAESLTGPSQIVLAETVAKKYFGRADVVGEMMTLSASSGDFPMQVVAVIKDVAMDSHFNSSITDDESLGVFALTETVNLLSDELKPDENWGWLSSDYFTYLMTDGQIGTQDLENRINELFRSNAPKDEFESVSELKVRPLVDANLSTWYTVGMPVIEIVEYLGILVLLIAIINYANLATAQNMGRFREVGLRKTLGADRKQLLIQFLIECQSIVFMAMILSLAITELAIPIFNNSLDKILTINYLEMLPWLIATTIVVGLLAGAYPAFMISKTTPSQALSNSIQKGRGGIWFRNIMIGTQFVISIIMMALVMVIFAQNQQVTRGSEVFPKSQIMDIGRIDNDTIIERKDVLHREISALEDVEIAAFSTQVPFQQQNWHWQATNTKGDFVNKIDMNNMMASFNFLKTYNIPIIAGRDFSRDITADYRNDDKREINIIINEIAAKSLGYATPADAVGKSIYLAQSKTYQMNIIGVMADRNILGIQNQVKPFALRGWGSNYRHLSVRLKAGASADTITKIEDIWSRINPEFPIDWSFLDAEFEEQFKVMRAVNKIFAGFSVLALALALFGLFGLAAFMAEQRTREIGIRKVLGAGTHNIVKMLILQFSHPVIIAILFALPLAYLASEEYLGFFAEPIAYSVPLILVASMTAVALSWGIIAIHAIKVAKSNPIKALRYE